MTRSTVLGSIVAAGLVSGAAATVLGQAPQGQPRVIEVVKVRDNLFMLTGGGGNTGVFVTDAGVVVVDTKNAGWGQLLLDRIKTLTDKPVTTIINTHVHGDHSAGNVEFPATVEIIAHENTKANMSKTAPPRDERVKIFEGANARFLPKRVFKDRMSIGAGKDRIDLYYFGRGHTDGDAFVVFPALRAMHAGDQFPGKYPPLIDAANQGTAVMFAGTLAKAVAGVRDVDAVITGHGPVLNWADFKEYVEYNRELLAWAEAELKSGRSIEAIASSYAFPAKWQGYSIRYPIQGYLQALAGEMKAAPASGAR
jgi:glyoxylase-like metal-dependent hydrolase (beta-lactamase superfamily II)